MRSFVLGVAFALSVPTAVWAQVVPLGVISYDTAPSVSLSTDQTTYTQFETILATVRVTNTSATEQDYGHIRFPNHPSAIYYVLTTPSGDRVGSHHLYLSEAPIYFPTVPFQSGETQTKVLILPLIFLTTDTTGTYTLEVYYRPDPSVWDFEESPLASVSYNVVPPSASPVIVEALRKASCLTLARSTSCDDDGPSITEAAGLLDEVLVAPSLPAHMQEWALLLRALYLDQQYADERMPAGDIQAAYDAFLTTYPDSPYAIAAGYGVIGSSLYGGLEPDDTATQLDLTTLPAAASIASSTFSPRFQNTDFLVSGRDHDIDGAPTGSGDDRHALAVSDEAARTAALYALDPN